MLCLVRDPLEEDGEGLFLNPTSDPLAGTGMDGEDGGGEDGDVNANFHNPGGMELVPFDQEDQNSIQYAEFFNPPEPGTSGYYDEASDSDSEEEENDSLGCGYAVHVDTEAYRKSVIRKLTPFAIMFPADKPGKSYLLRVKDYGGTQLLEPASRKDLDKAYLKDRNNGWLMNENVAVVAFVHQTFNPVARMMEISIHPPAMFPKIDRVKLLKPHKFTDLAFSTTASANTLGFNTGHFERPIPVPKPRVRVVEDAADIPQKAPKKRGRKSKKEMEEIERRAKEMEREIREQASASVVQPEGPEKKDESAKDADSGISLGTINTSDLGEFVPPVVPTPLPTLIYVKTPEPMDEDDEKGKDKSSKESNQGSSEKQSTDSNTSAAQAGTGSSGSTQTSVTIFSLAELKLKDSDSELCSPKPKRRRGRKSKKELAEEQALAAAAVVATSSTSAGPFIKPEPMEQGEEVGVKSEPMEPSEPPVTPPPINVGEPRMPEPPRRPPPVARRRGRPRKLRFDDCDGQSDSGMTEDSATSN